MKPQQMEEKMLMLQEKIIHEFQSMLPLEAQDPFVSYWMSYNAVHFRACCEWVKLHALGVL